MLTIDAIKRNGWLIFEVITGSKAYGLDTEKSDTDIRGVFVLPKHLFYGLEYTPQVNNETNDIVYYELRRFIELLSKNNPNILELLNVPDNCVLYRHPLMDFVKKELFLSKLCEKTFVNYAYTQIKKAYGLEKKIVNPVEAERKSILEFCFIYEQSEATPLVHYLRQKEWEQARVGLTVIPHLRDCYNLFYNRSVTYSGILRKENANDIALSSIPKGEQPLALMYFNKDGYSVYCKRYKEYWEWVEKRNDERYKTTMAHGKNYDSKNMMHVFRLLLMAKEIASEGQVNVYRKDRDFLLSIKNGGFDYDELLKKAEEIKNELAQLFAEANLKAKPDLILIDTVLVTMRAQYYAVK
jgi:uncharacterized protein